MLAAKQCDGPLHGYKFLNETLVELLEFVTKVYKTEGHLSTGLMVVRWCLWRRRPNPVV